MRPCCRGRRLSAVSQALNVSRAQLSVRVHRKPGWQDGRHHRQRDDATFTGRIMEAMAELPSYGYRRVWALLRRQSEATEQPVVNAKRVYRVMREHGLLLEENQLHHWPSRHIRGVLPSRRAIDGGAQMASSFAAITVKTTCHVRHGLLR